MEPLTRQETVFEGLREALTWDDPVEAGKHAFFIAMDELEYLGFVPSVALIETMMRRANIWPLDFGFVDDDDEPIDKDGPSVTVEVPDDAG